MNNFYNTVKRIIEGKDQPAKKVEKIKIAIDLVGELGIASQTPSEPRRAVATQEMINNATRPSNAPQNAAKQATAQMIAQAQAATLADVPALSSSLPPTPPNMGNPNARTDMTDLAQMRHQVSNLQKKGKK